MSRRAQTPEFDEALRTSYWREHHARTVLEAWSATDLSLSAFAGQHGLLPERLYRWQRRLGAEAESVTFHPVEVVASRLEAHEQRTPSSVPLPLTSVKVCRPDPSWGTSPLVELSVTSTNSAIWDRYLGRGVFRPCSHFQIVVGSTDHVLASSSIDSSWASLASRSLSPRDRPAGRGS